MRDRVLFVLALSSAAFAAIFPLWALAAVLTTVVVAVVVGGWKRRVVAIAGGLLTTVAFGRFLVEYAAPNIVSSGTKGAEEHAVSRLREVWFAERQARDLNLFDTDGDGRGEYVFLDRLVTPDGTLLKPGVYVPQAPPTWRVEGFELVVYLPAKGGGVTTDPAQVDAAGASERWIAYAWPGDQKNVGYRAFYIDWQERICELRGPHPYVGAAHVPPPFAALTQPTLDAATCMQGTDGFIWRPWKHKKARND